MKICSKCKVEKTYDAFGKKASNPDGYSYTCKECVNHQRREAYKSKEISESEREKKKDYLKKYYQTKKNDIKEKANVYYSENKEKVLKNASVYRKKNRDKINKYLREYGKRQEVKEKNNLRYQNDINYKMKKVLRGRIIDALKKKGNYKTELTEELIGCSISHLLTHLETQFKEGMSWENHGFGDDKWHIDHIIPCDSFNLENEEERRKCFNFNNLQPLWQFDNISKGNRLTD